MLLIGPPGSGKTGRLLGRVEAAVRTGRGAAVKLLVPTASMRQHLLFVLARKGLMVPTPTVSALSEFIREATPELREATGAVADRLLRTAIERAQPDAFGSPSASVGLRNRIAALIGEFWAAGADNLQVEAVARNVRQRAFQAVFREYEELLAASGFVHHNQRIARAAATIRQEGLGPVREVCIAGFDRFTRQQEELLDALREQADELLVAMLDELPRYPLEGSEAEYLPARARTGIAVETVEAASPRAEVLEIARRILESGRPLREHGIVLRSLEEYRPVLREVFDTLRIPLRIWERERLFDHGVTRHFLQWLRVIERRFPGEPALEVLASPLTPAGAPADRDACDFAVRERLPGQGLDFLLRSAAPYRRLSGFLNGLRPQADWHRRRYGVRRWARECLALLSQVQSLPVPADGKSFRRTREWRTAVRARSALQSALEEVPQLPDLQGRRRISLGVFAEALEDVLRSARIAESDQRYEVVHVLSVLESRQWSLPVTFACGLAEGWFPRRFSEDLLFDDEDRRQMRSRGIELRTSLDRAEEERFLYRIAATRATGLFVRSYPLSDFLGKPLMRSTLLIDADEPQSAAWVRLEDPRTVTTADPVSDLPEALRDAVAGCNRSFSVTGIQNFRQCPHLYFAGHTLRLQSRPALPERRLDGAQVGMIVHEALARWNRERGSIGAILDAAFQARLEELHLDDSVRAEQLRLALRSDLERFAREQTAPKQFLERAEAFFESDRRYEVAELDGRPVVNCRIDRFDLDPERRCVVTDYKYARPDRVKTLLKEHLAGDQLQLPLYLAALQQELGCEPVGMALCGLKGSTSWVGLTVRDSDELSVTTDEELGELVRSARSEAADALGGVLRGSVAVRPRDRAYCQRFCDYRGVCRIQWSEATDGDSPEGAPPCS